MTDKLSDENIKEIMERHVEISEELHFLIIDCMKIGLEPAVFSMTAQENLIKGYIMIKGLTNDR